MRNVAPLTGHPWTNSTSGPLPTRRYGDLASADVEEAVGSATEEVGRRRRGEREHRVLQDEEVAAGSRARSYQARSRPDPCPRNELSR